MSVTPTPPPGLGPKYVEVIIDEEGEAVVEAHGFQGQGCQAATRNLEAKLGKVTHRTVKTGGAPQLKQRLGK